MKIVTAEQMREIDQDCIRRGTPGSVLMENAGRAVAEETKKILGSPEKNHILLLAGPGNNGGDGLVVARHLHDWGAEVSIYLCSQRRDDTNLELVRKRNIPCYEAASDENLTKFGELLSQATCVIDALLGTGKARPLGGIFKQVLEQVNEAKRNSKGLIIIAVDLPSGMNADTGEADPACPVTDNTITLAFPKLGLYHLPGAGLAGKVTIVDIGIPTYLADHVKTDLMTDGWAKTVLPPRPLSANKGSFGKALVVAGSINYVGAAYLACSGAIRAGVGLATLATPESLQAMLAARLSEVTYLPLPETERGIISAEAAKVIGENIAGYNALLVGCGLGQSQSAADFVSSLLFKEKLPPLVIDADGLNILAKHNSWWKRLTNDAIMTPHPGEMSRLTGVSIADIQADRVKTTVKYASEWQKTIVLKGAFTVIASPDGQSRVCPIANPGLASAGTGDVLAGTITGLVAQGLSLFDSASLGVYLHGKAGELVRNNIGDTGMIASDLLPALPAVIKQLKENKS